jgi:hypothetical protein
VYLTFTECLFWLELHMSKNERLGQYIKEKWYKLNFLNDLQYLSSDYTVILAYEISTQLW